MTCVGKISHQQFNNTKNSHFSCFVLCAAERGKEGASNGGQSVYCTNMSNPENNGP